MPFWPSEKWPKISSQSVLFSLPWGRERIYTYEGRDFLGLFEIFSEKNMEADDIKYSYKVKLSSFSP